MEKELAVLCFSGGLDSTCLLYYLLKAGYEVKVLSMWYGQKHVKELECAATIARMAGVEQKVLHIPLDDLVPNSTLTQGGDIPEGGYKEDSMKSTVVANRNMVLLALAGSWVAGRGGGKVAYAAHSGDHTIYPDCRPEFISAVGETLALCDWNKVELFTPFAAFDKGQVLSAGMESGAPVHLSWTCYKGQKRHCGKCGACVERKEAFNLAGYTDPTGYEE